MTKFYRNLKRRTDGSIYAHFGEIEVDLTQFPLVTQAFIKALAKLLNYEEI